MHPFIKQVIPHVLAIVSFIIFCSIYFYPQYQSKMLSQSDTNHWRGFSQESIEYGKKENRQILWTNAIFIGMPTIFVSLDHPSSLKFIQEASNLFFSRPSSLFLSFLICAYILFIVLKIPPLLSVFGALAIGFTTNNIILLEAGHNTKLVVLSYSSLIVLGFLMTLRKNYIWGGIVLALGLALNINGNHIQMTYYLALCMLIGVIAYTVHFAMSKEWKHLGICALVFFLSAGMAILSNTSKLWTSYELAQETMRGKPVLTNSTGNGVSNSEQQDGLDWDYAMSWSNGLMDVAALMIPGVVGGGSGERVGSGSTTYTALRRGGVPLHKGDSYMLPLYWGALPFTSGPIYAGAIVSFLFILSLFIIKGPLKWWLGLSVLLTILLSLGKNFEPFQRLFFDYFPLFNKFRTPNSVLSITVLLMPILAFIGLWNILNGSLTKDQIKKGLIWTGGITGGLCLFFMLAPSAGFFSFQGSSDAQLAQSTIYDLIIEDRKHWMRSDAFRSLAFIALVFGLILFYMKNKISKTYFILIFGSLTIWDMMQVNLRYLQPGDFTTKASIETFYEERPVDRQILSMEPHRGAYRVLDLSVNTFNSSRSSYLHNTVGGYHAAKLQRVQDIIDHHISRNNAGVLNMLNTKYIITQDEQLSVNPDALGNAWLVTNIISVKTPEEEIQALNTLDTRNTAVVLDQEFDYYVGNFNPDGFGNIELTHYIPDHWTYTFRSQSEQFAVFSESWYGSGGLKAYIDGIEVPFVRANYVLRGLRIPAGEHTIEFKFLPTSYIQGLKISQASSLLLICILLGFSIYSLYLYFQNMKMEPKPHQVEERQSVKRKKPGYRKK